MTAFDQLIWVTDINYWSIFYVYDMSSHERYCETNDGGRHHSEILKRVNQFDSKCKVQNARRFYGKGARTWDSKHLGWAKSVVAHATQILGGVWPTRPILFRPIWKMLHPFHSVWLGRHHWCSTSSDTWRVWIYRSFNTRSMMAGLY